MSIEEEVEKYAKMFQGVKLDQIGLNSQTKWNEMIVSLLIEIRDKLDELVEK